MIGADLGQFRRLLFLSTEEAAQALGNVSVRAWRYWESGGRQVPDDVARAVLAALQERAGYIAGQPLRQPADVVSIRAHQSAMAHLKALDSVPF